MENWKPIPGYEGIYDASDLGRIRSAPGKTTANARYDKRVWKSRIMKPKHPHKRRMDLRLTLWKDGQAKDYLVARLVAAAWHGAPAEGMTVNHINGNYLDNRPSNLEWISVADNVKHAFETGLYSSFQKKVVLTNQDGDTRNFRSMAQACRYLGRNNGYISCLLGRGNRQAVSADGTMYTVTMME